MATGETVIDTQRFMPVSNNTLRASAEWLKDLLAVAIVSMFVFVLLITPMLRGRLLTGTPELRVAVVAREMIASDNYLVPTLGGEPRFNKPPLVYWLVASAAKLLDWNVCSTGTCEDARSRGPDQRTMIHAVEITSAFVAALTLFIIGLYGCVVFSRTAGVLTGLIFGLLAMTTKFGWMGSGDTTLMLTCAGMFCAASWLVCMPRPGVWCALGLGISLGLAILAKGYIALLLLLAPLLAEALMRRSFNGRKALLLLLALVVAAAIATPWFLAIRKSGAWAVMQTEVQYAIWPTSHDQSHRWSYYPFRLLGGLLPWTPLLIFAWPFYLLYLRPRLDQQNESLVLAYKNMRFLALAFGLGFLGFYAFPKQQEHYLLPMLPPLALASAFVISQFKNPGGFAEERLAWTQLVVGLLGTVTLIAVALCPIEFFTLLFPKNIEDVEKIVALRLLLPDRHVVIAIGVAFAGLYLYLARQCVEGRVLRASIVLATLTFIGMLSWCRYEYSKDLPKNSIVGAMPRVRAEVERFGDDIKVYTAGISQPLLIFYLERPILTLRNHLCKEPAGKTPAESPQRILVGHRVDLMRLKLEKYLLDGDENIVVVALPKDDVDWPQYFQMLPSTKCVDRE
ncbi:MAG: hypothetical protein V1899_02690 [Planctomycetota bacterium]